MNEYAREFKLRFSEVDCRGYLRLNHIVHFTLDMATTSSIDKPASRSADLIAR